MTQKYRILVINPGSTSTKISVFENDTQIFSKSISHPSDEIKKYTKIIDQYDMRAKALFETLKENNIDISSLSAVAGRGGNMKPVKGGTYLVNEAMKEDLKIGVMGQHASNLGGLLADEIASKAGIPAYVVDPVVVDEFEELARFSGMPEISRKSKDHPLNQKAAARRAALDLGGKYDEMNFIVCHMGGGISVGMHKKGKIIDVNNCLDGDGPFSPERAGGLPVGSIVDMCFSGNYTKQEIMKKIVGGGGLVAYLGTSDAKAVEEMIESGDKKAQTVYMAMAYQIAKDIGAGATVLCGKVDAIVLTGGLIRSTYLQSYIKERVGFIAPVMVYPGEFEMLALAQGAIRAITGEEQAKIYE